MAKHIEPSVALIGFGVHQRTSLLPSLRYLEIPIGSVMTRNPDKVAPQASRLGIDRVIGDIQQLKTQENLLAVVMCTSAKTHIKLLEGLSCINVPIFVEKPVGESAQELHSLIESISNTDTRIMVGFQKRFAPAYMQTKRLIDEQRIKPSHIDFSLQVGQLGQGVDYLLEVGIHGIDVVRFFLGEVAVVAANAQVESNNRRNYTVLLENEKGVTATLRMGEMRDWHRINERLEVTAVGHQVVVDNMVDFKWNKPFAGAAGYPDIDSRGSIFWQPNFTVPVVENNTLFLQGYVGEFKHFFAEANADKPFTPGLNDALKAMEIIDAIRSHME